MKSVYLKDGDALGLGGQLGYGGEGRVFEIEGDSSIVAKIYHRPIPEEKLEKLQIMTTMGDKALTRVAAWPIDILYTSNEGEACGITLPRIDDFVPLHVLYNPSHRKASFPNADWKFLLEVALDLAKVIGVIHRHDLVIGDINSSNFVVGKRGDVHAIDCDSFQVVSPQGPTYRCEVGVIEYTPPELQGVNFSTVEREEDHDRFGLAVLVFQLLFLGRHPFAGVPLDGNSNTIGEAIEKGLFAYGGKAKSLGVKRPPLAPELSLCGSELEYLFEKAFETERNSRPSSEQWKQELQKTIKGIVTCKRENVHTYLAGVDCPWCELETKMKGRFLFPSLFDQTVKDASEIRILWAEIEDITLPRKKLTLDKSIDHWPSTIARLSRFIRKSQTGFQLVLIPWAFVTLAITSGKVFLSILAIGIALVPILILVFGPTKWRLKRMKSSLENLRGMRNVNATQQSFVEKKHELTEVWKDLYSVSDIHEQEAIELATDKHELGDYLKSKLVSQAGILKENEIEFCHRRRIITAQDLKENFHRQFKRNYFRSKLGPVKLRKLYKWRRDLEYQFIEQRGIEIDKSLEGELKKNVIEKATQLQKRLLDSHQDLLKIQQAVMDGLEKNSAEVQALQTQVLEMERDLKYSTKEY